MLKAKGQTNLKKINNIFSYRISIFFFSLSISILKFYNSALIVGKKNY